MQTFNYFNIKTDKAFIAALIGILSGRGYIAGSYAYYATNQNVEFIPTDIDIFLTKAEYMDSVVYDLIELAEFAKIKHETETENVTTIKFYGMNQKFDIQIIKPDIIWKNFPDDIIKSFDLNVCQYVIVDSKRILGNDDVSEGIKILKIHDPLLIIKRINKYINRGYHIKNTEMLKIFNAWDCMADQTKELYQETINSCDMSGDFTPFYTWTFNSRQYFYEE